MTYERKERVSIDTRKAISLLADTSDICDEQVSNQSAHATPWAGCDGPSVETTDRGWCFASPGPFGPRGEEGLLKICGNGSSDEGHQGMGANLIYHSIRGVEIETSFSIDGSDPVLVTFPESGEVKIVPLESWDGYTRVFIPLDAIDGDDIEAALGKVAAAPLPYTFRGAVYGNGGLAPLTYGSNGLFAVYQTARCPGFLRRQRVRGHTRDIQGDILIPEDIMWMPGRLKLSRAGDSFVGNLLKAFIVEHPFNPLDFFAQELTEAQVKYKDLVLSPPESPTVKEIKALTGLFSTLLGWNCREIPDIFQGSSWEYAWEDFGTWFEGWETWIEGDVRAAGIRYFRDPEDPQAAPLSGGLVFIPDVIEELRSEERVPVVGIQKDWFARSGWGVLCLFGGMGDPTHDFNAWDEERRMHEEYAAFSGEEGAEEISLDRSGMERVSNPAASEPKAPRACMDSLESAMTGHIRSGCAAGSEAAGTTCSEGAGDATRTLGSEGSAISALVGRMMAGASPGGAQAPGSAPASGTARESPGGAAGAGMVLGGPGSASKEPKAEVASEPEPETEESPEPESEEPDTHARAREVCRGRARVAPGGPKVEMVVIREEYRDTGGVVPTVRRPDKEAVPISAHDMRLYAVWSYLTAELQRCAGIQSDLFVAIDNTDPMSTRAGKTVETQAYCIGQAVVVCSRAHTWLGGNSLGKKPHMQDVDTISALIRTCSHEIAHVLVKGDAHSPAWVNMEKRIWRAVSKKGLFKQVKAILKPNDATIAENLPRAD